MAELNREVAGKVAATADLRPVILRSYDRAESDLRPFTATTVVANDAPLYKGIPRSPLLWVKATGVLSGTGEYVSDQRPKPTEITIDSDVRFVATPETNESTTGKWLPFATNLPNYFIDRATLPTRPTYEEFNYVSGREVISVGSWRIQEGTKWLCRFNDGKDALSQMSMAFVIAPNPQTESYPVLDWYHADDPEPGERLALWLGDRMDFFWGGTGGSVDPIVPLNRARPMYVVVVLENTTLRVTVAHSPRHAYTVSKPHQVGPTFQWTRFQIGGSYQTLTDAQEADFSLMEVDFWQRALSKDEVAVLISNLTSAYGVDSAWR